MNEEKINQRAARINEIHCLGNNSIIPGQRTWVNERNKNGQEQYKYPGIMEFRDLIHLAIYIVTPTPERAEQYGLLNTPGNNPKRRKHIEFIQHNLQQSLEAETKGDLTLTNYFEERLHDILMIRHGLDPSNESERKRFKAKINEAKQVAQELRQETINQLETVINDKRLLRLTELQEINKHGSLFALIRRAFLKDTDDKTRAEAIHMLALTDAALKIVLHRDQAEGTLGRIEEIIDNSPLNSQDGKKIGSVQQKILYCIHEKDTLYPLFVAENPDDIRAYIEQKQNRIDPKTVFIAWHPFPCRRMIIQNGENKVIEYMCSGRIKTSESALAKYLVKNGSERPRDQNGIRFIVQNPNDAIELLTELHKALSKAGLCPIILIENQYTNYLFNDAEIQYQHTDEQGRQKTVYVQLPKSTNAPTNPHSAWNAQTSEVFQCDVEVEIQGEKRKFELRIVTPRQYLWDAYDKRGSHPNYVIEKKWGNKTTKEEEKKGYKPENLFSRIFPNRYLRILDEIDRRAGGKIRRRIANLAEPKTAQTLKEAMAIRIHKENRRRIRTQRVKIRNTPNDLTIHNYAEHQLANIANYGKPDPKLAKKIRQIDQKNKQNRRLN